MSGAAVAVMVAKARRRIVTHFTDADALYADRAVAFTPRDRRLDQRIFRRMQHFGAINEVAPGHYWLDEERLAAFRAAMRRRVAGVLALGAAAVALVTALS